MNTYFSIDFYYLFGSGVLRSEYTLCVYKVYGTLSATSKNLSPNAID